MLYRRTGERGRFFCALFNLFAKIPILPSRVLRETQGSGFILSGFRLSYPAILPVLLLLWLCYDLPAQSSRPGKPKNVILMIGDGMGLSQIAALDFDKKGGSALARFPVTGLSKTHSFNSYITDSAAGATAMACGLKTYNNSIGMTADTVPCKNLFEYAKERALGTGVVVTSSVTHATPAAFVSHQTLRSMYEQIAMDYLQLQVDCVIGGGMSYFTTRLSDDKNLLSDFERLGYYVSDYQRTNLQQLKSVTRDKLLYFTALTEPLPSYEGRDYLADATEFAAEFLDKNHEAGFILVVEGSQIDFAGHANDTYYLYNELHDFDDAITRALQFAIRDGETLIIVTADHATGGLSLKEGNPDRRPRLDFESKKHVSDMVPVFAYGPGSQLFNGTFENTAIFHKIAELLKLKI